MTAELPIALCVVSLRKSVAERSSASALPLLQIRITADAVLVSLSTIRSGTCWAGTSCETPDSHAAGAAAAGTGAAAADGVDADGVDADVAGAGAAAGVPDGGWGDAGRDWGKAVAAPNAMQPSQATTCRTSLAERI